MKNFLLLFSMLLFIACDINPKYESNLAVAKKWVQAFEDGNIDLWKEAVSDDLQDVAPMYGMGTVDYETSLQVAEFYVQNYTDVKFNEPVWLPGIDTLTMKPDGSVRAYGRWSGKSLSTGREFSVMSYHNFDFEDGKISSTGEYFDATGMVNAVGPVQRNVIVVTIDLKRGKYNDLQALFESGAGLKTTRNYEGCNHVEGFFNEEKSKYVVIQHWDSFEQYNAYAEWRFNEDPSGLVGKMLPLINGGADGISIYSNNTGYGFY